MSARLTLLLLCDRTELHSPLTSALLAAGFQLLIQHNPEVARIFLSHVSVDAIMIRHDSLQDSGRVSAALKLVAPHTPIILFAGASEEVRPQPGIASICRADPYDETVVRGVAVFFHNALAAQLPRQPMRTLEAGVQVSRADSKTQLTL